ncbi:RNA 2',3'-cyclic phosphodiesterase [Neobacillus sp. OS1-32]|uniref:RNA 2',3'-cyclic phosphodiesterase n=1 Tax=Neobacillus paridis TaxID=2803862 RepID=A0ABS1TNR9_9BACI|nr:MULTISPECIES: RNA 2',3'-cyclic phosphodiesterase [Neobacillus]MBL4951911.1 RNA 2',3'-cyclic phosphodiesterase [Neobacillus paridis]WML30410.1 RNA 2',3'-cyclic phosphodiesterase [Neobacillus sp. OS1-32]
MQQTHYFFAVRIPEDTKVLMKDIMEKLQQSFPFDRWVHHQDLHITLAFLGAAEAEKLTAAESFVREGLETEKSFRLQINGLGVFGREDSPRVFWADTVDSSELRIVRNKVYTACGKAGFQLETRPFRPHITLARKWSSETTFQKKRLEVWQELQSEPLSFQAKDVVLYQTYLNQTPKYKAITIFPLQS